MRAKIDRAANELEAETAHLREIEKRLEEVRSAHYEAGETRSAMHRANSTQPMPKCSAWRRRSDISVKADPSGKPDCASDRAKRAVAATGERAERRARDVAGTARWCREKAGAGT